MIENSYKNKLYLSIYDNLYIIKIMTSSNIILKDKKYRYLIENSYMCEKDIFNFKWKIVTSMFFTRYINNRLKIDNILKKYQFIYQYI